MSKQNILIRALDGRWRKLQKEQDRARRRYDQEVIHDLRVASRRLIAVLEILKKVHNTSEIRDLRRQIKKLLHGLSPVRDLQVQRIRISGMADRYPQLKDFERTLAARENQNAGKVQRLLKQTSKLDGTVARVRRHVRNKGTKEDVLGVIDEHFRKLIELVDRIDPSDRSTIHAFRVAFKKFRYTCEIAQPLLDDEIHAGLLKEFRAFQTMMGDIQDIEVLLQHLSKWAAKHQRNQEMKPVLEELRGEQTGRIENFMVSAQRVRGFWR